MAHPAAQDVNRAPLASLRCGLIAVPKSWDKTGLVTDWSVIVLSNRGVLASLRLALFIALAGTLILALTPLATRLPIAGVWDKFNHAFAFTTLALLCGLAFPAVRARYMASLLLGLGVLIEVLQAIPAVGRSAEFGDVLADAAGIAIGFAIVNLIRLAIGWLKPVPALKPVAVKTQGEKAHRRH